MTGILTEDIKSNFKTRLYGCKGDEVQVIGDYGTALIVQAANGDRYPIKSNQINFGNEKQTKTTSPDHSDEQPVQRRDSLPGKGSRNKAPADTPLSHGSQATLF